MAAHVVVSFFGQHRFSTRLIGLAAGRAVTCLLNHGGLNACSQVNVRNGQGP
jgi:hypothetical protein